MMNEKLPPPLRMEVPSLEDLAFLASSLRSPVIHVDYEKKIAFSFLMPIALASPVIYYCKLDKTPEMKFAQVNRMTGRVRFSNEISAEPNEVSIPMIKVKVEGLI